MTNNNMAITFMLLLTTSTVPLMNANRNYDYNYVPSERSSIALSEINNIIEENKQQEIENYFTIKKKENFRKKIIYEREKTDVEEIIHNISINHDFSELLLQAVVNAESTFNPNCIGPDTQFGNAYGLMQLLPSTAKYLNVSNIFDPYENVDAGTRYLIELSNMFNDKEYYNQDNQKMNEYDMAIIAYNWGPTNLINHINTYNCVNTYFLPKETFNYINKIKSFMENDLLTYQYKIESEGDF